MLKPLPGHVPHTADGWPNGRESANRKWGLVGTAFLSRESTKLLLSPHAPERDTSAFRHFQSAK